MIGAAAVFHYFTIVKTQRESIEASEQLNVALGASVFENTVQDIVADLIYLAQQREITDAFESSDPATLDRLGSEFQLFAGRASAYDQLQLLDETGAEVVTVQDDGHIRSRVADGATEQDQNRVKFVGTWALDRGQVYASTPMVRGEAGEVNQHQTSVLQFGTPVYGPDSVKQGVLLLGFRGAEFVREFDTAVSGIADRVMILDADGSSLRTQHDNASRVSPLGDIDTFRKSYPDVWENIRDAESGQVYTPEGLITFSTVAALQPGNAGQPRSALPRLAGSGLLHQWKILSYLSSDTLGAMARLRQDIPLYVLVFAVLVLVSMMLTSTRLKNKKIAAQMEFEKHFRQSLENISLLAFGIDSEGSITFCNESMLALTGWQRDELIGKDWLERLVPSELREQYAKQSHRRVNGTELPDPYVAEIQTRDGARRVISWSDAILSDNEGKLFGTIQIGEDITESRRTQEALRKLSRAVEQSPSIVMIVDLQGRIEYVNPKFTESTGYTIEEVIGKNPRILKSGETSSEEYSDLWSTISTGGEWRGVFHNQKKDGELFWEAASISPIRDSDGTITHYLAVKEDITDRKRLEREVETRNQEIVKNRELAVMGRMASMIAHDLRNPLSSIKMALQIIADRVAGIWRSEEDELQKIALEQVGYMEEILEDLLSFSRPDALKPEWVNIGKILDQTVISCQKQIEAYAARLDTWYQPGLPTLHADPRKLRQVFSNIIMNALQATEGSTERKPEITVTVQLDIGAEQPQIHVEICDNGRGIGTNKQEKLCEPFFTTRAKGTGLGLAIVRRIVVQHHGSVTLAPVQEGGTRVTVVLPTGPIEDNTSTNRTLDIGDTSSTGQRVTAA